MTTRPKVIATPTCVTTPPETSSITTAPVPANTIANVPKHSAAHWRNTISRPFVTVHSSGSGGGGARVAASAAAPATLACLLRLRAARARRAFAARRAFVAITAAVARADTQFDHAHGFTSESVTDRPAGDAHPAASRSFNGSVRVEP